MNVRKVIRLALVMRDKNQSWLANELGIERQTVSRWCIEDSSITVKRLESIGEALDFTLTELIALDED